MKILITTMTIAVAFQICALAESSLSTTDGTTYENISFQRADPDGLYIEYHPGGSGLGVAKVKFARLSPEIQKQYSYDAAKASQFETQTADADHAWVRAELSREEAARQELAARADREQMMEIERLRALGSMRATEASGGPGDMPYYYGGGGGLWLTGVPERGLKSRDHLENRGSFHDRMANRPNPLTGWPPAGMPGGGIPFGKAPPQFLHH